MFDLPEIVNCNAHTIKQFPAHIDAPALPPPTSGVALLTQAQDAPM